jgi:predicted TIM-barrel fold metal-dependent hydrolase
LPQTFGAWGSLPSGDLDPRRVDALLDEGFAGLTLPATAVCTPDRLERCSPVLEALERRSAPLFVHPGAAARTADAPPWWPALTDYVAQMNAAWHAFVVGGRASHPRLRVLFAMLAGGAPLHAERLAARRGPAARVLDPGFFYDTSSYGTRAVDAIIRVVGVDQIVFGSDRPVAKPPACALGEAVQRAARITNPARLLGSTAATA